MWTALLKDCIWVFSAPSFGVSLEYGAESICYSSFLFQVKTVAIGLGAGLLPTFLHECLTFPEIVSRIAADIDIN